MSKTMYPWDEAPEWAKWAARNWDGTARWFAEQPYVIMNKWDSHGRKRKIKEPDNFSGDFTKSLEKRPDNPLISYPWRWAPEWAEFGATDENGKAWWFKYKPTLSNNYWRSANGPAFNFSDDSPNAEIWDKSLEKRPDTI